MDKPPVLMAATRLGRVAYRLEGDSGPLLAGLHGSPGSGAQMLMIMDQMGLVSSRCRRLVIDRAGYQGTPLEPCRTMSEQADLFAALLDELHIETLDVIIAFSGGGIMALEFAGRHPQRVRKLLLLAAVTGAHPSYGSSWFKKLVFTAPGMNLLISMSFWFPRTAVKQIIAFMSTFGPLELKREYRKVIASRKDRDFLLNILRLNYPFGPLRAGFVNDAKELRRADIHDYAALDLPILLLHGRCDADVDCGYAESLSKLVASASLIEIEDGYHLLMVGERFGAVREHVFDFCGIAPSSR